MTLLQQTLCQLEPGEARTFRNLTLFPLLGDDSGPADYLTLDEALAQKAARITEINTQGSVPELRFVNDSDRPVFLMDGEELVGAKQNRTLNLSILAPARSTLLLPVTCVEAGRWAHASVEFASAPRAHYAAGRALKQASLSRSLRTQGDHRADQGEVWADIDAKAARMAASSPTQAMGAMYEQHEAGVSAFQEAFPVQPRLRGAVFTINGAIIGLDLFASAATLSKLWPKIVASYALDALDAPPQAKAEPVSPQAADRFLEAVAQAETERFAALGLGEDVRLKSAGLAGGALVVEGRVVHLSAFAAEAHSEEGTETAALRRASARRQHWQQSA